MLALEGIKVLDLAHLPPGALCTMILGDLGTEVIKIEALSDTGSRGAGLLGSPEGKEERKKAAYDALNRNKKSIGLNLKSEEGHKIFHKLAQTADVIVEGFRPGAVKRLGVDYETVKEYNPKIIYCSLSGYGQDGPYNKYPGHDINYISMGGALNLIGNSGSPPVIPLNLIADFAGASLYGVIGILSALVSRNATGKGQHVDIAFMDGVISLLSWFASDYFSTGTVLERGTSVLHGVYPYYGVYEAKDGKYISLGCVEPWFWENLCRALSKEEYIPYHFAIEHWLQRPEGEKWEEISNYLKQIFLTKTRDDWFDLLIKKDIPVAKVYGLDEVFNDPQVLHRQMVIEIEHPKLGKVKQPGIAIKLSETPGKIRSLAPLFGENTEEVLLGLGYDKSKINELHQNKVIA